ncbi:transporter [Herbaspirillum sp. RTI4]|uniref:transporter n=1 Tax=Herbaspirillum sp. RTI4 TaxID=3048640 RepID=UPI002AB50F59|nr:transporter [Herbaspirillum sp. RTI4]MDY7580031.1 transporter [Herbaspirillum sp. RTI4]MEA9982986.1 transporter [Herbaspirillum sp. RTI4]
MTKFYTKFYIKHLTIFASLYLAAHAAHAVHPLVTDDTGTQDTGNQQIELNTDWIQRRATRGEVANFTYSYGVSQNLDAIINVPRSNFAPAGLSDVTIGGKWRFFEQDDTSFALKSFLSMPTGDQNQGLGSGRVSASAALISSHVSGPWAWHTNLGVAMNRYQLPSDDQANRRWLWQASTALVREISEQWKVVGDIGIARNPDVSSHTNPAYALTGLIYSPAKNLDFDVGFKYGLNTAEVHRQLGVGVTWRF